MSALDEINKLIDELDHRYFSRVSDAAYIICRDALRERIRKEFNLNGFEPCEWDNRKDRTACEECGCVPDVLFYRDGRYRCRSCVKDETDDS